jgi:hypothetical protein
LVVFVVCATGCVAPFAGNGLGAGVGVGSGAGFSTGATDGVRVAIKYPPTAIPTAKAQSVTYKVFNDGL